MAGQSMYRLKFELKKELRTTTVQVCDTLCSVISMGKEVLSAVNIIKYRINGTPSKDGKGFVDTSVFAMRLPYCGDFSLSLSVLIV